MAALVGRYVEVKKSEISNTNMLGLFSRINSNMVGTFLTRFQFEEEMKPATSDDDNSSRYSIEFKDGRIFFMTTRPKDVKMLGYYVNEARGGREPNCYISERYYKGRPTAQLRVLTEVKKGQELFCNYGDKYAEFD